MRHTISYTHEMSCAHRLAEHHGKCRRLHGHNYVVTFDIAAESLDRLGMVIDFGTFKQHVVNEIDTIYDHRTVLHEDDPLYVPLRDALQEIDENPDRHIVASDCPPTAEHLAETFLRIANARLNAYYEGAAARGIRVVRVRVQETAKGAAQCCLEGEANE